MLTVYKDLGKLAAVYKSISKEESRYYLHGAFFDLPDNRIVATNGHTLNAWNDAAIEYDQDSTESVIIQISKKAVTALSAAHKKVNSSRFAYGKEAKAVFNDDKVLSIYVDGELTFAESYSVIEGIFPDYKRVMGGINATGAVTHLASWTRCM